MKLPFIKYIESLVMCKYDLNKISFLLSKISLYFPIDGMEIIYKKLHEVYPDYFIKNDPVQPDILQELQISKMISYLLQYELSEGTQGIAGAFEILSDPLMYRLITSLALAKMTNEDIELIVNGKYNIQYSPEDINQFLHYFFNVKSWTLPEKTEYIDFVTNADLKKYYSLAVKGDKDYLLWKLGAAPEKSFDAMLKEMAVDSFYNFKEKSKSDQDAAQKWGQLALKITEKLDKLEKDTNDKKDFFSEVEFKLKFKEDKIDPTVPKKGKKAIKHISELNKESEDNE